MNLDYFLAIFLSVLAVIPGIVLIYQYKRTKINDTLIFAAYFIIGGFVQISNVIASQTNVLIYFQMQYMGFNLTFFLLFIHVIRVKGNIKHFKLQSKFQTLIWNVGILWFMILEIMIVFWKSFPQPQTVEWFSLAVPREDRSIPFPYGAGLKFNDTIVYSSDYDFLGHLFAFYVVVMAIYTYYTIDIVKRDKTTILAKRLWLIAFSFAFGFTIVTLPFISVSLIVARSLLITGTLIVVYISLKYPEALLLSKNQLIRAISLYKIAEIARQEGTNSRITSSLMEYLIQIQDQYKVWNKLK